MTDDLDLDDLLDDIAEEIIAKGPSGKAPKTKKRHGLNGRSLEMLRRIMPTIEAVQPITGRGVGYKMFVAKLIPSMSDNNMQRVYHLLKEARDRFAKPRLFHGNSPPACSYCYRFIRRCNRPGWTFKSSAADSGNQCPLLGGKADIGWRCRDVCF